MGERASRPSRRPDELIAMIMMTLEPLQGSEGREVGWGRGERRSERKEERGG